MFAIGIRYLNGWAMAAADGAKKERAEWPPHPDRIFMALAAAYFETDGSDEERAALEWLESQAPPCFADFTDARQRTLVIHYVPVNDAALSGTKTVAKAVAGKGILSTLKDCGLSQLPEFRSRQPRSFPVVVPAQAELFLRWEVAIPDSHRTALNNLCRKVTHVGHSASFVQMWLTDQAPPANLVTREGVTRYRLRIPGSGRLRSLETRCNRVAVTAHADLKNRISAATGKAKKTLETEMRQCFPHGKPVSLRPETARAIGYGPPDRVESTTAGSLFDPNLIVLSLTGHRLDLRSTLKLTEALRNAAMKACPQQPPPEWLSGHTVNRHPSRDPHLAFLALPFVDHEHADGRVPGLAIAAPRAVSADEIARCLGPLFWDTDTGEQRTIRLFDGQWFDCAAQMEMRETPPYNLRIDTWTKPSQRWASVTPVVFDRHYDGKDRWELAAESTKDACERIGLTRPVDVLLHPVSMFAGTPKSNEFPHIVRKTGGRLHHCHALLTFAEPVRGPILIGAGRFRGYGLCRPWSQGGAGHD